MRDDVVVPSNSELILQNAPEREGTFLSYHALLNKDKLYDTARIGICQYSRIA